MELEDQVTNLELSKKLKELGVKQESLFCWGFVNSSPIRLHYHLADRGIRKAYSAFLSSELAELLPEYIVVSNKEFYVGTYKLENKYFSRYAKPIEDGEIPFEEQIADTEANARAKMLIYLIENNLINL